MASFFFFATLHAQHQVSFLCASILGRVATRLLPDPSPKFSDVIRDRMPRHVCSQQHQQRSLRDDIDDTKALNDCRTPSQDVVGLAVGHSAVSGGNMQPEHVQCRSALDTIQVRQLSRTNLELANASSGIGVVPRSHWMERRICWQAQRTVCAADLGT